MPIFQSMLNTMPNLTFTSKIMPMFQTMLNRFSCFTSRWTSYCSCHYSVGPVPSEVLCQLCPARGPARCPGGGRGSCGAPGRGPAGCPAGRRCPSCPPSSQSSPDTKITGKLKFSFRSICVISVLFAMFSVFIVCCIVLPDLCLPPPPNRLGLIILLT